MRIHSTLFALATAALVATGCGDSTAPKPVSHVGRYALISVDGQTLPLVLINELTFKLTVTEGALTLKSDNTFLQEVKIDVIDNGAPAPSELLSCGGTYQRNGNNFTLTSTATQNCDAGTATGTLNNNTLTISDESGSTLIFRR